MKSWIDLQPQDMRLYNKRREKKTKHGIDLGPSAVRDHVTRGLRISKVFVTSPFRLVNPSTFDSCQRLAKRPVE